MSEEAAERKLVWLQTEIKTPPFSADARRAAGFLLRQLQRGVMLTMPDSRPMPDIGPRCHELRIADQAQRLTWRIIYRIDQDAIIIGEVFAKKSRKTPERVIKLAQRRFRMYDEPEL